VLTRNDRKGQWKAKWIVNLLAAILIYVTVQNAIRSGDKTWQEQKSVCTLGTPLAHKAFEEPYNPLH
jgi:hypothetical protein